MKPTKLKKIFLYTALIFSTILMNFNTVFAANFKDVSENHWAYSEIEEISNRGILGADIDGNFNPNLYIDKFETAKILAKLTDFDPINKNQDEKYKNYISQYQKTFTKWNSTADSEIAFLLEKNILKQDDLNHFIIKNENDKEQLRALSREELAVFITRLLKAEQKADKADFKLKFKDDKDINEDRKNAVYYINSTGIMQSKDGNFEPKAAITKAELSSILIKYLNYQQGDKAKDEKYEIFIGTVKKVYTDANSILIEINGNQTFLKTDKDILIKTENEPDETAKIKENDKVCFLFDKNTLEIKEINIFKESFFNKTQNTDQAGKELAAQSIFGSISKIKNGNLTLSYREILQNSFSNKMQKEFVLNEEVYATKNGAGISISEIKEGDTFNAKVKDDEIYEINIENKTTNITGDIVFKTFGDLAQSIIIKSNDQKLYEIRFEKNIKLTRNNKLISDFSKLKVGDVAKAEFLNSKVVAVNSTGKYSKKTGYIQAIKIENDFSRISISSEKDAKTYETYFVDPSSTIIYSMRLKDKIEITLESLEVSHIELIEPAYQGYFSGEIKELEKGSINILNDKDKKISKIYINENTVFFNSKTGLNTTFNELKKGMKVYAVYNEIKSNTVKTITILED